MNKSHLCLITVDAVGPGETTYKVPAMVGEQRETERVCKCLNDFTMKHWTPATSNTLMTIIQDKTAKKALMDDLNKVVTMAQAKRIFKAVEHVCINHRVDIDFVFEAQEITAI